MSKQLEKRTCKFCEQSLRRIHPGNIVDWVHMDYKRTCKQETYARGYGYKD